MKVTHRGLTVDWLGYATVRIEGAERVVYLDPGRYGVLDGYDARDGDVVLITHDHHYDPEGVKRVAGEGATVVVYEGVDPGRIDRDVDAVTDLPFETVQVGQRERSTVDGVDVETTPAYNDPDGPHVRASGDPVHPEGFGVGYRVTVDGVTAFFPGDTDVLDFHPDVDASLFLPPIGGSFIMDREAAADLAGAMTPDLTLPVHYDTFDALEADAEAFVVDVARRGLPVVLDEP